MRQQRVRALLLVAVDEGAFGNAFVAGLVMLQAIGIEIVRQRDKKIVVIVMTSAEKRASLAHQPAVGGDLVVRNGQRRSAIGRDIQMMRRLNVGSERDGPEILARKHRRIDQRG